MSRMPIIKEDKIWLYSQDKREGQLFDNTKDDIAFLIANGWYDTPAKIPAKVLKIKAVPLKPEAVEGDEDK